MKSIAAHAAGYGLQTTTVDGNDVESVYAATSAAVERARSGGGASLIEAHTLRMLGHAVHDGAEYVPRELLAEWEARDPVIGYRAQACRESVCPRNNSRRSIGAAGPKSWTPSTLAEASPWPDPATVTRGVYAPSAVVGASDRLP